MQKECTSLFEQIATSFADVKATSAVNLSFAYLFFSLSLTAKKLSDTYQVVLDPIFPSYHTLATECIEKWISSLLSPSTLLTPYFASIKWEMRDQGN